MERPYTPAAGGDSEFYERTTGTQRIFDGKIIGVRRDTVELPDGGESTREVVEHIGGVGVLALDEDNNVLLVRQYRYAVGRELLEIPAGTLQKGEDTAHCAARELKEETGATAGRMRYLGRLAPEPAFCDQYLYLYLAQELSFGEMQLDEDEFLTAFRMPFEQLMAMVMDNQLEDAKTIVAALKAWALLKGNG